MIEPKKYLTEIAQSAPGVATAAAQKGLQKNETSKIAALVKLRNTHNELTSLPQNEAYQKFQSMDKQTRDALTTMFSPKYIQQDQGFVGNILNSIKTAVYYGGGSAIDVAKQVSQLGGPLGIATQIGKGIFGGISKEVQKTEAGSKTAKVVAAGGELLVRPQEKLIKQPYMAARLAAAEGANGIQAFGQYAAEGFKELLPGGEDATPSDNSTSFMKYWEQASNPQNVFDEEAVSRFNNELTPAASYLGRLLASKEDLVDNFDKFQDNPGVIDLVNRYIAGDKKAAIEVANAVGRFEKAKISPGRDYARTIIELFPHEAEKAIMGDGAAKAFFTLLSAPVDFTVTFGVDPLIIGGKVRRGLMVAKYGFFKVGEGSISIEKAFSRPKVRAYWDEAGKLVQTFRNGNLPQRAQALNRLQDRFPEININVIEDLAKADVRNADDALQFFDNGERFVSMMSGKVGLAGKDTLIPRMTVGRAIGNDLKDLVVKTLGTERYANLKVSAKDKEFIAQFTDDPSVWAEKIGFEKTGVIYTAKDKSILGKIDRVIRQFSIAPAAERLISISDGSSANQIFKLARTVLDKNSAGSFRAAWLSADEGQRLLMFKGLLKTLGVGMGLNLSNEGRLALSKIDDMSREVYSVSQSSIDIGDLADVLKTAPGAGATAPKGVRAKTQEAISAVTAEGKAGRLIASVNSKVAEYTERLKALRADKKEALAAGDELRAGAIDDEIKIVGAKLGRELKSKKELKAKMGEDSALTAIVEEKVLPANIKIEKLISNDSLENRNILLNFGLNKQMANSAKDANTIIAKDLNGEYVGHISWDKKTGKINLINVTQEYQRQGIASNLLNSAKNTPKTVKPIHEEDIKNLSEEGLSWRKAVTGEDETLFDINLDRFNAGQTLDGTPRAIRIYQLEDSRSLPDFAQWREIAQRGGVFTELFGRVTNNHFNKAVTDGWSFLNLYPRLGLRSTVEEVGLFGIIGGAEGFGYYLKGRLASRELRAARPAGIKTTVFGNEKSDRNLGFIYDTLFKVTKKHYSKEQLLAMADDPELLGRAVADSMIKSKFKPEFLQTKNGQDFANWAGDFAEFNGRAILDDINGSSVRAERPITEAEEISNSLKQFGPSVRLNVQNQEALKGMTFKPEFTEIANTNDKFVFNWLLELNNTVGKRNGQFGNIVLWNIGKKPKDVIDKLVTYIEGEGNEIAKRFAIYGEQGASGLARNIYLDATYPLRDFSGRINMDLVNAIRNKGGMENFTLEDLTKLDKPYARPESILGREIVPLGAKNAEQAIYQVINGGYGWIGKQIALLDREPITLANYFMFRKQLKGTQEVTKKNLIAQGLSEEGADSIARFSTHETAMNLARNRTLGFVDNGDVRTNLAYSLRTLGRYYRATEDFYRRLARVGKYEKRAIVRLAILNQTFEDSGFIHKDDKGQMYFTYPSDELFTGVVSNVMSKMGLTPLAPLPVNFGGYVKMLTPSLDPESQLPRLSNPFVTLALDGMTNLPYIGEYLTGIEKGLTGAYNTDIPAWEKMAPANVKRVYNALGGSVEKTASRFSSAVKAIKLLVSTGNGPTSASDLETFYENIATQAKNIDYIKLAMGQVTIASLQTFGNKDVPKELINAGVFTWDSEFQKFMKKFDGDPQAYPKAYVQFAKLYPSKAIYVTSASDATTYANYQKTIEAADFVQKNQKLLIEHSDAGSFFIPVSGRTDTNAYNYLKKKGFISNKPIDPRVAKGKENFIREVATTEARQAYYALNDEYNAKIAAAGGPKERRYWSDELANRKKGLLTAYPLLAVQVSPTSESNARRGEVIQDMKKLIKENKAPNKDLAETFTAMIDEYEKMNSILSTIKSSTRAADAYKKNLRADTKDIIFKLSQKSPNATTFFNSIIDPLLGE